MRFRRRLRRLVRRGSRLRLAGLLELHLLLELLAELPCHDTRAARPAPDLGHDAWKLFRSQHDECQDEDDYDLRESALEQIRRSVRSVRALRRSSLRIPGTRRPDCPSESAWAGCSPLLRPRSWPS